MKRSLISTVSNARVSGKFLYHTAHEGCGSSDGLAIYEKPDGSKDGYCWACQEFVKGESEVNLNNRVEKPERKMRPDYLRDIGEIKSLSFTDLKDRGIRASTCEKYGVKAQHEGDDTIFHYYPIHNKDGSVTAYQVRDCANKEFTIVGKAEKGFQLFGQVEYPANSKLMILCEGQPDTMAAYEMIQDSGKNYRVVGLHAGGIKSAADNIDYLSSFESVVAFMDQDPAGHKYIEKLVKMLEGGKLRLPSLPDKMDVNEFKSETNDPHNRFLNILFGALPYRPEGLVTPKDLFEESRKKAEHGFNWPWPELTKLTYGYRRAEVYVICSGTGNGKTEMLKEVIFKIIEEENRQVGIIMLEETPAITNKILAGKKDGIRYHLPDAVYDQKQLEESLLYFEGKITYYDHRGFRSWEELLGKMNYMAGVLGIKDIVLDNLTPLTSGDENEKRMIDKIIEDIDAFKHKHDATVFLVSHLNSPSGTGHEEGLPVRLHHLYGSGSIKKRADYVIALERNQYAEDEKEKNTVTIRILKDRKFGLSNGKTFKLFYDHNTGKLVSMPDEDFQF